MEQLKSRAKKVPRKCHFYRKSVVHKEWDIEENIRTRKVNNFVIWKSVLRFLCDCIHLSSPIVNFIEWLTNLMVLIMETLVNKIMLSR